MKHPFKEIATQDQDQVTGGSVTKLGDFKITGYDVETGIYTTMSTGEEGGMILPFPNLLDGITN
ncbi:hypothetical protein PVT67_01190 [Gallaecimonas kandeliae]|uniref:hypothetical protein n=1 Tax=Gallaecimonas kandeliae TaxID=3029055 RepID=UPI0026470A84|nr:hypothetical protein [Gallaecimonas kandeliae]WKE65904.1 hypothetical protein PVT67_01190 [Gallaecimonas kandeliae]